MSTEEPPPPSDAMAEIRAVVTKAKQGDASAVPRLRELLDQFPALRARQGDLSVHVEQSWVALAGGTDLHLRESLLRVTTRMRADLLRPSPPPVETLLTDRVVACWLQVQYFSGVEVNAIQGDAALRVLQYRGTRQAQAQRMFDRAVATLVAFQKLHTHQAVSPPVPVAVPVVATASPTASQPSVKSKVKSSGRSDPFGDSFRSDPEAERVRLRVAA